MIDTIYEAVASNLLISTSKWFSWLFLALFKIMLERSRTAWMLRRYPAGSNAGSGGLAMGSSGIEAGGPLPLYPGDLRDVFDVRALLTVTNDSCSSLSLWIEFFESLRLKSPIVSRFWEFHPRLWRDSRLKGTPAKELKGGAKRSSSDKEFTKEGKK